MARTKACEEKGLKAGSSGHYELISGRDLVCHNALKQVYDHIHKMRVEVRSGIFLGTTPVWGGPLVPPSET